jgi:hypothetical protein
MRMKSVLGVVKTRKKYYCTECEKHHGKASLKKWYAHRKYKSDKTLFVSWENYPKYKRGVNCKKCGADVWKVGYTYFHCANCKKIDEHSPADLLSGLVEI